MNTLKDYISEYLNYCEYRKQLNFKTIKAYKKLKKLHFIQKFSKKFENSPRFGRKNEKDLE